MMRRLLDRRARSAWAFTVGRQQPLRFLQGARASRASLGQNRLALVDERWVDEDDAGSNAALVKRTLMTNGPPKRRALRR